MFGYSSRALPSDIRRLVPVQDQLFKVGHFICDQGPAAGLRSWRSIILRGYPLKHMATAAWTLGGLTHAEFR